MKKNMQLGLYDPSFEFDSCGVGFAANIKGVKSFKIVSDAITMLENMEHRGATGYESNTGDGAGLQIQIPHELLYDETLNFGFDLPNPNFYGVGMLFFPQNNFIREECKEIIAQSADKLGLKILGYRPVPVNNIDLGNLAKSVEPVMEMLFVERPFDVETDKDFERKLFVFRNYISHQITSVTSNDPIGFYVASFSCKKLIYILTSTNNFPEFTGRICPAPCEGACVLGINNLPVAIEEIEKNIIEIAFEQGFAKPRIPQYRTDKKVAVIGSGPAGLASAYQLNQAGHQVTVFERDSEIGGLLRFGIPDFKLNKNIVERRVQWMEQEGVEFRTNVNVGVNYSVEELNRNFDAVVLALGSTVPRDLMLPNRDAKGVHYAMDFLIQNNKKVSGIEFYEEELNVKGKKVVVIGGGDTGSDCIGTSNRQGAEVVYQIYYKPMQPTQRDETMPWPTMPMTLQVTSSHEEGCERKWSVNSKEFVKDENGNLTGVRLVEAEWTKDADGKWNLYTEKPNSAFVIECDYAFIALGYTHVEQKGLVEALDIHLDPKGNLIGNNKEFLTNQAKYFSCGDARKGQSLVVWAIAEGRDCAKKVDEFLKG